MPPPPCRGWRWGVGPSEIEFSLTRPPPGRSEGPGPLRRKQKHVLFSAVTAVTTVTFPLPINYAGRRPIFLIETPQSCVFLHRFPTYQQIDRGAPGPHSVDFTLGPTLLILLLLIRIFSSTGTDLSRERLAPPAPPCVFLFLFSPAPPPPPERGAP